MLLEKKTGVIYGAGAAVGGVVARAFAREGANVFLNLAKVDVVAKEILAAHGSAEAGPVDVLDERCSGFCSRLVLGSGFAYLGRITRDLNSFWIFRIRRCLPRVP